MEEGQKAVEVQALIDSGSESLHPSSHPSLQLHPPQQVGATSDKKTRRGKKQQRRRDHEQAQNGSGTPSTLGKTRRDLADITCFNCNKKEHYVANCLESERDASED